MKKILLLIALFGLVMPSLAMAADAVPLGDGSSIDENSKELSLSPNVELSYHTASSDSYALTGASTKGTVTYGIKSGDPVVYQTADKAEDGGPKAASDTSTCYDDWSKVGQ